MAFNNHRWRALGGALGLVVLAVCMLLYLYYPAVPHSVIGWVLLVVVGIPTWFFLEWLGEVTLGSQLFTKLSSGARIAIAVPVIIVLMLIGGIVVHFGQRAITAW
jgi:hypothetical protein